jgi:L-lactate dehydrogenase complex protein LldG
VSEPSSSARDAILAAVREARPPAVARPDSRPLSSRDAVVVGPSPIDTFAAAAIAAGAEVTICRKADVARVVDTPLDGARSVLSFVDGITSRDVPAGDVRSLAALDALVCDTRLGVAENGAVWFATSDERFRAALFLAERVVVVVDEGDIVADLHAAYERLDIRAEPYGVLVAGPSKTADIEQALVIGAHGPKALTLVVVRR